MLNVAVYIATLMTYSGSGFVQLAYYLIEELVLEHFDRLPPDLVPDV